MIDQIAVRGFAYGEAGTGALTSPVQTKRDSRAPVRFPRILRRVSGLHCPCERSLLKQELKASFVAVFVFTGKRNVEGTFNEIRLRANDVQ